MTACASGWGSRGPEGTPVGDTGHERWPVVRPLFQASSGVSQPIRRGEELIHVQVRVSYLHSRLARRRRRKTEPALEGFGIWDMCCSRLAPTRLAPFSYF
jgi:hypothetical protein